MARRYRCCRRWEIGRKAYFATYAPGITDRADEAWVMPADVRGTSLVCRVSADPAPQESEFSA